MFFLETIHGYFTERDQGGNTKRTDFEIFHTDKGDYSG